MARRSVKLGEEGKKVRREEGKKGEGRRGEEARERRKAFIVPKNGEKWSLLHGTVKLSFPQYINKEIIFPI